MAKLSSDEAVIIKSSIDNYAIANDKEHIIFEQAQARTDKKLDDFKLELKEFQGMTLIEFSTMRDELRELKSPKYAVNWGGLKLTIEHFIILIFLCQMLGIDIHFILQLIFGK